MKNKRTNWHNLHKSDKSIRYSPVSNKSVIDKDKEIKEFFKRHSSSHTIEVPMSFKELERAYFDALKTQDKEIKVKVNVDRESIEGWHRRLPFLSSRVCYNTINWNK